MRTFSCLLFLCYSFASSSQDVQDSLDLSEDTINVEIIEQYTSYFKIVDGELEGIGSEILQDEFANSQFVLLGETHDDVQTALFTNAILPILAEEGYKHFVLEQGRSSLDLLFKCLKEPIEMQKDLRVIHQESVNKSAEPYFPFMNGVEDAAFMQTALNESFEFHGIDQEYFYSFPFLFNQLSVLAITKSPDLLADSAALFKAHLEASEYLLEQYKLEKRQKDHPLFTNLLNSSEIKEYFNLVNKNPQNDQIIQDILLSWKIYEQNRLNRNYSFKMRGDLMKSRFKEVYAKASRKEINPKMLIKLGGLHIMRGNTPLGIEDIGEQAHQMADKNSGQDLNIYFMFRYYLDKEEELGYFDNAVGNSNWLNERKPILLQGKVDEWALIDLKSLKAAMEEEGYVYLYPPIKKLISRHDYILIPPATEDVRPNYEPKAD